MNETYYIFYYPITDLQTVYKTENPESNGLFGSNGLIAFLKGNILLLLLILIALFVLKKII